MAVALEDSAQTKDQKTLECHRAWELGALLSSALIATDLIVDLLKF